MIKKFALLSVALVFLSGNYSCGMEDDPTNMGDVGQNQEKIVNVLKVIFKDSLQKKMVLKDIVNEAYGPKVYVFDDSSMTKKYMAQSAGFDIYKVKVDSQQDLRDGKAKYSLTRGRKHKIDKVFTEKCEGSFNLLPGIKKNLDNKVRFDPGSGPYKNAIVFFCTSDD